MNDRKLIGEWKGKLTIYGISKERKIQIFKVKNQKNKIVLPSFRGPKEGTLLAAKRKKQTFLGGPNGNLEFVSVTYSQRGSHQGGPMHTYNSKAAFASKDEKILESLMKFLQKHITKGKVKKTIKRGGGKTIRMKPEEFKNMISEMESSAIKENQRCNNSCYKIKTNHAKDKTKLKEKRNCHQGCEKKRMKTVKAFHKKYPKEFKGFVKSLGGGKKMTVKKKIKKENNDSVYFEFDRFLGKGKFWRITKNGSKITTHYGKIGTLGQMTTKDYGSKVDQSFDSLLKSKKKKGYVEKEYYGHVSESNPKPPTKVEREYLRICKKAEKSKVLNPNAISQDCEAMLDQGESELKWMTGWHKDALKNKDYDWTSYEEHSKSKRKKK